MITGDLKNKIDRLWLEFWQGGITNPLTVIEQITYLMFIRLLDLEQTRQEKRSSRTGKPFKGHFAGPDDPRRWGNILRRGSDESLKIVRDDVFPHIKEIAGKDSTFGRYMADATFMINKPALLTKAMELINDLPLEKGDIKGDVYEYLLSKLTTAGIAGQFRTPRHIIRMMVDLVEPQLTDRVADPACGTAGFLASVIDHLNETHSSEDGTIVHDDGSKSYLGDEIPPEAREHMRTDMFCGMDFDVSMLRIAAMNMMLHGVDNPSLAYMDTLSNGFPEQRPKEASDAFDVILANPPFKGAIDFEQIHQSLSSKLKTKKTELLFPLLILRMLKLGGRAAVVVPDGVLFGSSKAHKGLRSILIDDNQLEGVIKLPAGVFKPYAGVSTAVLVYAKGGKTTDVFFYDVQADGYSLDDKRTAIDENDIPDVIKRWKKRSPKKDTDRKAKAFFVPVDEIREAGYDLSLGRYKETVYEEAKYDSPKKIIARLRRLNEAEAKDLRELEGMIS